MYQPGSAVDRTGVADRGQRGASRTRRFPSETVLWTLDWDNKCMRPHTKEYRSHRHELDEANRGAFSSATAEDDGVSRGMPKSFTPKRF